MADNETYVTIDVEGIKHKTEDAVLFWLSVEDQTEQWVPMVHIDSTQDLSDDCRTLSVAEWWAYNEGLI